MPDIKKTLEGIIDPSGIKIEEEPTKLIIPFINLDRIIGYLFVTLAVASDFRENYREFTCSDSANDIASISLGEAGGIVLRNPDSVKIRVYASTEKARNQHHLALKLESPEGERYLKMYEERLKRLFINSQTPQSPAKPEISEKEKPYKPLELRPDQMPNW